MKKSKEKLNSGRGIGIGLFIMTGLLVSITIVGYSTYYVLKLFLE